MEPEPDTFVYVFEIIFIRKATKIMALKFGMFSATLAAKREKAVV